MAESIAARTDERVVLLATDLSSRCDRALDRAARLASAWQAHLVVLNVIDQDDDWEERRRLYDLPSWRRPPDPQAVAKAQIQRDLRLNVPSMEVRVIPGEPAAVIDEVAGELGADLIITGIARNETLGRYFVGSTVDRLARLTAAPLLIVKSRCRSYNEVLVATDFSDSSRHALASAAKLFPGVPLTLLHAFEIPFAGFLDKGDFRDRWRALVQESCDAFVDGAGLSPDQRQQLRVLVERGCPEALVRAYMQDKHVDLVVIGTHGRSGLFDIRLGGTAKRILEFAPGDVLLIREPRAVQHEQAKPHGNQR